MDEKILNHWRNYFDENVGILSRSGYTPHNTITPIARKKEVNFELDLVLRNNRCDDINPDGIFHPHKEFHHIKKENIDKIIKDELDFVFEKVLEDCGVFKWNEEGKKAMEKYIKDLESYVKKVNGIVKKMLWYKYFIL